MTLLATRREPHVPDEVASEARRNDGVIPSSVGRRFVRNRHTKLFHDDGFVSSLLRCRVVEDPLVTPANRVVRVAP